MRKSLLVFFLLSWFCTASLHAQTLPHTTDSIRQAHKAFEALSMQRDASWRHRISKLERYYQDHFSAYLRSPESMRAMPVDDVRLVYETARAVAFYSGKAAYADDALVALNALRARHAENKADLQHLYRTYISTRQFTNARQLAQQHPSLDVKPLPTIDDHVMDNPDARPTVLTVSAETGHVDHVVAPPLQDTQIVVIAHPLCHFTRDAVRDLVRHPTLWKLLTQHAVWIAPQDGNVEFDAFQHWNKAIPAAHISIAYQQSDWTMIDYWGTPTFFFLKHGKVVDRVTGWPKEGRVDALLAGMRAIGLDVAGIGLMPATAASK